MTAEPLSLPEALDVTPQSLVSFVGGGGKSSLMFALARTLPGPVVMTTTTRIFAAQMKLAPAVCTVDRLEELESHLSKHNVCLVVGTVKGDKALGVEPMLPGRLLNRSGVQQVLVEADGSRMRPVKAPADHEPVIPPETTHLVPVVGIDALGHDVYDVAHRPELVTRLLTRPGDAPGSHRRLTAEDIARLIVHPQGGLKNAPGASRVMPFVNKVETETQLAAARQIARHVLDEPRIDHVLIGAVKAHHQVKEVYKRVVAIVLAAGESKRMGRLKQTLPWGNTTILGQTLRNLKQSTVHDILVVSGHEAERVERIAAAEGCQVLFNPQYAAGEMLSSLKTGVAHLPDNIAAVLVMLADQPMLEPEIINQLSSTFWQGRGELIAPSYEGQRGNPVLIGRTYFEELLTLPPDVAPRELLFRHPQELVLVPVNSDSVLKDLDRPEDFERWRP